MSSRSVKQHEKLRWPPAPPPDDDETDSSLEWRLDWNQHCEVCGQRPCTVAFRDGVAVMDASRCLDCIIGGQEWEGT